MNVEEFLRVADAIEAADRFNLNYYVQVLMHDGRINHDLTDYGNALLLEYRCDSVGCVAGWVNALNKHQDADDEVFAADKLGIKHSDAWKLFAADRGSIWARLADEYGWDLNIDYYDGENYGLNDWSQITAAQAADVLRRIANGEVEL